jgi:two-component system OmpR family sensor kinase
VAAGLALAVGGWLRGSRSYSWIGLGCSAIALAHIGRVSGGAPSTPLDLSFASLNLYGTVLVVCGLTRLALHALWALDETQSIQQEELRLAKMDLRRAAEQDHELRNGLAGLAGAAGLLVVRPEESAQLRAAMAAELARLDALLRSSRHGAENVPRAVYSVASILRQQVALRRCAGMDVRLDADPELTAAGTPATLAQVVTNVLANCVEHAPGSPVRVRAARRDGSISIWISDDGPGVPPGTERSVFRAGARGVDSDGQGLGLHISQRLLRVEGGSIEIMPRCREHTGCTVWIQLSDAAPTTDRPGARVLAGRS